MSYEKIECVVVICDNCGEHLEDYHDFSIFPDETSVNLEDNDWHETEDKKHYCPKCHKIDDDDNLVILTPSSNTDK